MQLSQFLVLLQMSYGDIGGKLSILYFFLLMFSQEFNNSISICVAILHLRPLFSLPGTKAQEDDCNICKKDKHEMK